MIKDNKKWKIYIATHKKFYPEMYEVDSLFSNEHYCIMNVGQLDKLENQDGYDVIDQKKLPEFHPLGPWWAESEGIYNLWKNGVHKNLDYIGFSHYDKEQRLIKKNIWGKQDTNITERIEKYLSNKKKAHISMENHLTKEMYLMRSMADVTRPNEIVGDGMNAFDFILNDYNSFFGTSYSIKDFLKKKKINLCSCFLIDVQTFDKMMRFFEWVIVNKHLDVFDTEHKYRAQGGLAERYFGLFLLFEYSKSLDLSTIHHYNDGLKEDCLK